MAFRLAAAPPPPNDTAAGAIVVPAAGPFPYLTPVMDMSFATMAGDPVLTEDCGDTNLSRGVWFQFTPAASGSYTLSVGPDTATDFGGEGNTDTMMALYTAPDFHGPFSFVACNDDSLSLKSALSLNLNAGTKYYAVVWVASFTTVTNQPLRLQMRVTLPVAPANDTCAGAEVIPGAGPFPYVGAVHDTTRATDTDDPVSACDAGFRSVWFKFTPTAAGTYIFSVDSDTATTIYEMNMVLFSNSGGCGGTYSVLSCALSTKIMTRALSAGVPVYLVVSDFESSPIPSETSVQLRVSLMGPPTVVTLPPTGLSTTGAVLNLSINPNNLSTRWFFEWGPSLGYGNMTTSRLVPTPLTLTQFRSEPISGITPGITYHYRAVGSNSQGKIFGLDQSFLVSTNRPVITGQSALAVGNFLVQFSATTGQPYIVQGSSSLLSWQDLGTARELGGGQFEFVHSPGAAPPYRFYKIRAR